MAQTMRGARQILNELQGITREIGDASDLDRKQVIFDPQGAYEALQLINELAAQLRGIVVNDLPPMLERAASNREAASVPDRVATLESQVAELRQMIEGRSLRLVEPPRTGTKD
jgi:hypothetical protein